MRLIPRYGVICRKLSRHSSGRPSHENSRRQLFPQQGSFGPVGDVISKVRVVSRIGLRLALAVEDAGILQIVELELQTLLHQRDPFPVITLRHHHGAVFLIPVNDRPHRGFEKGRRKTRAVGEEKESGQTQQRKKIGMEIRNLNERDEKTRSLPMHTKIHRHTMGIAARTMRKALNCQNKREAER